MTLLGLEIRDHVIVAVTVDEGGARLARVELKAADAGAATLEALAGIAPVSDRPMVGVAAVHTDSVVVRQTLDALKTRYGGAIAMDRVAMAGTAAAVAETWVGAARGAHDVAYLCVSDHVSAGMMRGGAPVTGARGRAASVAWLALNPVEREDYRKTGCLEAEVSAAGIVRRLVWRIKAGDASAVQQMVGGDLAAITLDHVIEGARTRDGVSISVMRDTAKYVGMAAANLVAIGAPETLILGGIIAAAPDVLFDLVKTEIARRLPEPMMKALTIAAAALGADAAAIGAARLAAVARP